ncbi:MAG: hypothetical protein LBU64_06010 [Planctomycetota bacterium]|jgi:hypothetical protein|nr:hypothetical protein [Planctomycetota bacterium]
MRLFSGLFWGFALGAAMAVPAGESGPRAMSSWLNAVTPEGWQGRRYQEGEAVIAEEFDSNGDGRIDIWRFYHRGLLTSEERDLAGGGRVDCVSRWDSRNRRLVYFGRDGRGRGIYDLEILSSGARDWEIREDRNLDGITDRVLFVRGDRDLFDRLGFNPAGRDSPIEWIPPEYWRELRLDDGFTGEITDYRRYGGGGLAQQGRWEGRRLVWRRAGAEGAPPPSPAAAPDSGLDRGEVAPLDRGEVAPGSGPDPESGTEPGGGLISPPYRESPGGDYEPEGFSPPPRRVLSDRTRYEGLPPGESAARSLPLPMRPPGVGRR